MINFGRKFWAAATSIFRIHIGISSAITFLVIILLVYNYLLKDLIITSFSFVSNWYDSTSFGHSLILGIIASLLAVLIFGFVGVFLLSWYSKMMLTGEYDAFDIDEKNVSTPWGKATIKYYPLSTATHHTAVKIRLKHDDVVMEGDGLIIDNLYLIGHYTDTGKPERRRSGSFIFKLRGGGNIWDGRFVYVDPSVSTPSEGRARWEKA